MIHQGIHDNAIGEVSKMWAGHGAAVLSLPGRARADPDGWIDVVQLEWSPYGTCWDAAGESWSRSKIAAKPIRYEYRHDGGMLRRCSHRSEEFAHWHQRRAIANEKTYSQTRPG